jgi:hypothetical protein
MSPNKRHRQASSNAFRLSVLQTLTSFVRVGAQALVQVSTTAQLLKALDSISGPDLEHIVITEHLVWNASEAEGGLVRGASAGLDVPPGLRSITVRFTIMAHHQSLQGAAATDLIDVMLLQ